MRIYKLTVKGATYTGGKKPQSWSRLSMLLNVTDCEGLSLATLSKAATAGDVYVHALIEAGYIAEVDTKVVQTPPPETPDEEPKPKKKVAKKTVKKKVVKKKVKK